MQRTLLNKRVDIEDILALDVREQIGRAKYIPESEMHRFDDILAQIRSDMRNLTDEGDD